MAALQVPTEWNRLIDYVHTPAGSPILGLFDPANPVISLEAAMAVLSAHLGFDFAPHLYTSTQVFLNHGRCGGLLCGSFAIMFSSAQPNRPSNG